MTELLCFSNAFGLGPTGNMQYIVAALRDVWPGRILGYVSEKVRSNIEDKLFDEIIVIDDRNEQEIISHLEKYKNPIVFSFLNRFALSAAVKRNIKCAFYDSLTWMWEEMPSYYMAAGRYYSYDMPGAKELISRQTVDFQKKAVLIPFIKDNREFLHERDEKGVLIYVGGLQNPFSSDELIQSYLGIIKIFVSALPRDVPVTIASDERTVDQLKEIIVAENVEIATFSHDEFLDKLRATSLLVCTPGFNIIKEALLYRTPFGLLFPTNWSQYKQQQYWVNHSISRGMLWSDFIDLPLEINSTIDEKHAIQIIGGITRSIEKISDTIDFQKIIAQMIDRNSIAAQNLFLSEIGTNGKCVLLKDFMNFALDRAAS